MGPSNPVRHDVTLLTAHDIYLFKEGNHFQLFDKLGARVLSGNWTGELSEALGYLL